MSFSRTIRYGEDLHRKHSIQGVQIMRGEPSMTKEKNFNVGHHEFVHNSFKPLIKSDTLKVFSVSKISILVVFSSSPF